MNCRILDCTENPKSGDRRSNMRCVRESSGRATVSIDKSLSSWGGHLLLQIGILMYRYVSTQHCSHMPYSHRVQLPLDIDESCEDVEVLAKAAASTVIQTPDSPTSKSTSMTGFIYLCQLRKLESSIQQTVYRVDNSEQTTEAEIERFYHRLQDWKSK